LFDGRRMRILTVVDQWNREAGVVEPAYGYSGQAAAEVLDVYLCPGQAPTSITVNHGTEFTSKALEAWAWQRGVKLDFTHPGKPMENGHIEGFNGRLCDECLNVNQFLSLDYARETIKARQDDYNNDRPHGSLGNLTPMEYRVRHGHTTIGPRQLRNSSYELSQNGVNVTFRGVVSKKNPGKRPGFFLIPIEHCQAFWALAKLYLI